MHFQKPATKLAFAGLASFLAIAAPLCAQTPPRERLSIDSNWLFTRGDLPGDRANLSTAAYVRTDFDDRAWQRVNLPHDWAIGGPFIADGPGEMGRLPSAGVGWYRRRLNIPTTDAGKSVFLDVDGAMSNASVWLNGHLVGGRPYGHTSWRVDLSPYVAPGGTNELAIRLNNPPGSSRWYPGGGIYRHVWLTKTKPVHVAQWGTYVRTRHVSSAAATIDLDVTIDNDAPNDETVHVVTQLYPLDEKGRPIDAAAASIESAEERVHAKAST